jgi:hypothetical protein
VTLSLSPGKYYYKYLIDGKWEYDENENLVPDNFNAFNNVRDVLPKNIEH